VVELDLPFGVGVEFDALYRRVGYEDATLTEHTDSVWDFPVLAKYRFGATKFQPFVGGGWTYRHLGDLLGTSSSNGVVVSTGLRMGLSSINLSPEFRYTRWPNEDIEPGFRARQNQYEALVGLTF
jgi:hypothetical protein